MSDEKRQFEATRWFDQAVEDLEAVRVLRDGGRHAQACFYGQQAAEKALKALGQLQGEDVWGHSLLKLASRLAELGYELDIAEADLVTLDRFYIPTRYPNGVPEIIPQRAFLETDAATAMACAQRIIDAVRGKLPQP